MKRKIFLLAAIATLVIAPSGRTESKAPKCAALAMRDCAPWDGPAFRIFVAEPQRPKVDRNAAWMEISIWRVPDIRRNASFTFPDKTGKIGAVLFEGSGMPSVQGTVTFQKAVFGHDVEGAFDFVAPGGRHVTGAFRAPWLDDVPACG